MHFEDLLKKNVKRKKRNSSWLAKLFLSLIKHHTMKTFCGSGVIYSPRPFSSERELATLSIRNKERESTSAVLNALVNKMCPLLLPSIKLRFLSRPDRSLVAVTTDIFRHSRTSEMFLYWSRSHRADRAYRTGSFSVDKKKNQLDVTFCILYFSSNSCSTCFGQPCAYHQELKTA